MTFGCGFVVIAMVGLPFLVPAVHVLALPAVSGNRPLLTVSMALSLALGLFGMLAVAEVFPSCWSDGIDAEARLLAIAVSFVFYLVSAIHNRLLRLFSEAWRGV